ncbi:MAG: protein-L-isoaspartate(D-aspartate) O-methyltransferase [Spirochaetales bacterium]|nr:protein-L-isoaspartate(D-aspartate) O-methyltransferase [Spirochaetales bacterium]
MDRNGIDEHADERRRMTADQIAARGVRDAKVLGAFEAVPRHLFVPRSHRFEAYEDHPIPIGAGQTISQPYIVAYMTEQLAVDAGSTVLEIGTGSGYQAAILSYLAREVHTIETVEVLHKRAKQLLESLGYSNVFCYLGDGYTGIGEPKSFDRIIITAAAPRIPETLAALLRPAGRMILPVGSPYGYQELVVVEREGQGIRTRSLIGVRFVPMTGSIRRKGGGS